MYVLGRPSQVLAGEHVNMILATAGIFPGEEVQVESYSRAFCNGETIMGTSYRRSRKRCNNVVMTHAPNDPYPNFFQVHSFHHVHDGNFSRVICLVKRLQRVGALFVNPTANFPANLLLPLNNSIFQVHPAENWMAINLADVLSLRGSFSDPVHPQRYVVVRHSSNYFF